MTHQEAIRHLKGDPTLAGIIDLVGAYSLKTRPNRFRALVEAIVSQQLSGRVADGILRNMRGIYSGRFPSPRQVIATPDSRLREAGLSGMKIGYIRDISGRIESGDLRMRSLSGMSDEQVIDKLTGIKGIGVWTAQMFLIFSLGRQDVLPTGDLGIRKRFQALYGITDEAGMIRLAEGWRPYRTVAAWYLWKSAHFENIG